MEQLLSLLRRQATHKGIIYIIGSAVGIVAGFVAYWFWIYSPYIPYIIIAAGLIGPVVALPSLVYGILLIVNPDIDGLINTLVNSPKSITNVSIIKILKGTSKNSSPKDVSAYSINYYTEKKVYTITASQTEAVEMINLSKKALPWAEIRG